MKKKSLVLFLALSVSLSIHALNSTSYGSTAATVQDDASFLMNVIDWDNLKFEKFYAFSMLNSTSSGNVAGAFHLTGSDVLAFAWEGNLWSETSYNSLTGFYGWDKFALALNYTGYTSPSWYIDSNVCNDYKNMGFNAEFGCSINEMFDAALKLGFAKTTGQMTSYEIDDSDFGLGVLLAYNLKNEDDFKIRMILDYQGNFESRKAKSGSVRNEAKYRQNDITIGARLLYKSDAFTYGLYGAVPISIISGDDVSTDLKMEFELSNGFSIVLQPEKLLFNTGIQLTFPSLTFRKNTDVENGIFNTTFYAGFSFILNNMIQLDVGTGINPNNGVSFDDLWNQNFNISLSAKL